MNQVHMTVALKKETTSMTANSKGWIRCTWQWHWRKKRQAWQLTRKDESGAHDSGIEERNDKHDRLLERMNQVHMTVALKKEINKYEMVHNLESIYLRSKRGLRHEHLTPHGRSLVSHDWQMRHLQEDVFLHSVSPRQMRISGPGASSPRYRRLSIILWTLRNPMSENMTVVFATTINVNDSLFPWSSKKLLCALESLPNASLASFILCTYTDAKAPATQIAG